MKLLMVCLGNICRSPLAEGIMRDKIGKHNLDWKVDSAGTGSWHAGSQPDPRSIDTASKHGINITNQRARQFSVDDFVEFDIIFAMDSENYQNILKLVTNPHDKEKVRLIMNEADSGQNQSVPDPYWNDDGFENVFQMLERACTGFLANQKIH